MSIGITGLPFGNHDNTDMCHVNLCRNVINLRGTSDVAMLLVNNSDYGGYAFYDNYMKPIGIVVTSQAEMGPLYGHEVFFH